MLTLITLWELCQKFKYDSFVVVSPTTKEEIKFSYDILYNAELCNETEEDKQIITLSECYVKSIDFTEDKVYLLTDRA